MVQQYLDHSREILSSPYSSHKGGSKGAGLISLFGYQNAYDLRKGLPLLTTKRMFKNSMVHELIWFVSGSTNIKYLEDNNAPIWRGNAFEYNLEKMVKERIFPEGIVKYSPSWDKAMKEYASMIKENPEFAARWGEVGPIYGHQWRHWTYVNEKGEATQLDQLNEVLESMKKKPLGKRHLVTAWNPGDVPNMSLPPCHVMFQMTSNEEGEMDLQLYQRSCDMFLGVPFNLASYAILTHMIAKEAGLQPRRFVHTFGDSHFYTGLEKRSKWYKENLAGLKEKVNGISDRGDYLDILEWVTKNAPKDETEERYDHVTAILEQMARTPQELPRLIITPGKSIYDLKINDFSFENYNPHPTAIRRDMAV